MYLISAGDSAGRMNDHHVATLAFWIERLLDQQRTAVATFDE